MTTHGKLTDAIRILDLIKLDMAADDELAYVESRYQKVLILAYLDKEHDFEKENEHVVSFLSGVPSRYSNLYKGVLALIYMRRKQFRLALESFSLFVKALEILPKTHRLALKLFGQLSILPFIFITDAMSSLEEDAGTELRYLVHLGQGLAKKWKDYSEEGKTVFRIYKSASPIIRSNFKEGIAVLKDGLSGGFATSKNQMEFLKGMYYAVLARFSEDPSQAEKYSSVCSLILDPIGCQGLVNWAKGKTFSF